MSASSWQVLTPWEAAGVQVGSGGGIVVIPDEDHGLTYTAFWRVNDWVHCRRFFIRSVGSSASIMEADSIDGPYVRTKGFSNRREAMLSLDYMLTLLTMGTGIEQREI